jgi:hypothetical protein
MIIGICLDLLANFNSLGEDFSRKLVDEEFVYAFAELMDKGSYRVKSSAFVAYCHFFLIRDVDVLKKVLFEVHFEELMLCLLDSCIVGDLVFVLVYLNEAMAFLKGTLGLQMIREQMDCGELLEGLQGFLEKNLLNEKEAMELVMQIEVLQKIWG